MKDSRRLALGKKRRDNYLVERLMILRGQVDAAINADQCQEKMFALARQMGLRVPAEVYQQGIDSADELEPVVDDCLGALRAFRARTEQIRRVLETELDGPPEK